MQQCHTTVILDVRRVVRALVDDSLGDALPMRLYHGRHVVRRVVSHLHRRAVLVVGQDRVLAEAVGGDGLVLARHVAVVGVRRGDEHVNVAVARAVACALRIGGPEDVPRRGRMALVRLATHTYGLARDVLHELVKLCGVRLLVKQRHLPCLKTPLTKNNANV